MNRLLLYLGFAAAVMIIGCQKEKSATADEEWQEASLIGRDYTLCACCGGWFIKVDQDTVRAFQLPDTFEIDPEPNFPLAVDLRYEPLTGPCQDFGNLIKIQEIRKR
ncbi:hypothetical protein [Flavilitoribacter nigricans]|nr:hypothetical protein [Flavilitoribacter nigricans]